MKSGYIVLPALLFFGLLLVTYSRTLTRWHNRLRDFTPQWWLTIWEPRPRGPLGLMVVGSGIALIGLLGCLSLLAEQWQ